MKSFVVITKAQEMNYMENYVALPSDYGTRQYYERQDIKAIYQAVYDNLNEFDRRTGFTKQLHTYKHILIKPNLVSVYHDCGMKNKDYPESTDPRVLDAVVAYMKRYNQNIVIIESSGKPMPTKTSFKVSGIDRIAKHYKIGLVALETASVVRYMLPKAQVMKEVYIPEILAEVVRGESYYISVPKLKTNLYTKVTLGFKNAMGTIPYFLRERNHNYYINKKLADLLYLFSPNLVVIDGIIGGEGNTPAPVDPVYVGVIISGDNTVEVDKAATHIMGIDPLEVPLLMEAQARGFGSDDVEIIGEREPVIFRRANSSLMDDDFTKVFPNVMTLAGHTLAHAPKITDIHSVTKDTVKKLESACDGGCLAAVRSGFDYVHYAPAPNYQMNLLVLIGAGLTYEDKRYWFDKEGRPYNVEDIKKLGKPIMTVGNCANTMDAYAKYKTPGCCSPSTCMLAVTAAAGIPFPLLSFQNKAVFHFIFHVLDMVAKRCFHIIRGRWVDCQNQHEDKIYSIPELSIEESQKDFIDWPLPKMSAKMKLRAIKDQLSILKM